MVIEEQMRANISSKLFPLYFSFVFQFRTTLFDKTSALFMRESTPVAMPDVMMRAKCVRHRCTNQVICSLLLAMVSTTAVSVDADVRCLMSFKSSLGGHAPRLRTWTGHDPCSGSWAGVLCVDGRVASVVLDNSALVGDVGPLLRLPHLQVLSLRRNSFTGKLPALSNSTNPLLRFLLLSHNRFNGTLNVSLPSLVSLRLENNVFSGGLEGLRVDPSILDFNVSNNRLAGEIPSGLSKLSNSAFGGNLALCGSPLLPCAKTPSTDPSPMPPPRPPHGDVACAGRRTFNKMGIAAILAIGVGDVVVVSVVLAVLVGFCLRYIKKQSSSSSSSSFEVDGADARTCHKENKKREDDIGGSLVCFEGGEDLKLERLLKASAEVLGKGATGRTYKAVLDNGLAVVVKRLDEARFHRCFEDFDLQMRVVGTLRHAHVVSLRAYHSSPSEKLLVYDYMPNGSLKSLLHGRQGGGTTRAKVVSWRSRKEMLMEAAQGLNFIHTFTSRRRPLVHGNVKPSNILIDGNGSACIAEVGLTHLAETSSQSSIPSSSKANATVPSSCNYRAPEVEATGGKVTQASDVYSFGMVLLEVVTDKEIDDAEWGEEVMGMVKIGLMCTEEQPEKRPRMSQVVRMIGEML